jgi:hypothetical protein
MDPHSLVDTAAAGVPAPFWFIQFFKVLGFTLHMAPMNLWFAGIIVAMLLHWLGGESARRCSRRLMRQMPFIVALGVNFGIVPLLFIQLAYFKFFYPATILMAWFWMAIVGLLIPAYYGVYYYAWGWKDDEALTPGKQVAGWLSAVLFIAISFIYANAMSLMTNVEGWPEVWQSHAVAGATLGTGLNLGDPTLWPRWLLMFGLALGTTAAWMVVDAAWFATRENEEYHAWVRRSAPKLAALGVIWAAAAGSWYVFGTWPGELRETMFGGPLVVLTLATGAAGGLPLVLMLTLGRTSPGRATATWIGLAQFGVLAINAISRQTVQNLEIGEFLDLAAQPTSVQWSPLVMFLGVFVVGVAAVAWMLAQVVKASTSPVR